MSIRRRGDRRCFDRRLSDGRRNGRGEVRGGAERCSSLLRQEVDSSECATEEDDQDHCENQPALSTRRRRRCGRHVRHVTLAPTTGEAQKKQFEEGDNQTVQIRGARRA